MLKFAQPDEQPLVSVCIITYNHERWIRQAIESVLMQETDFSCELIIAEDCSKDNTRKIVEEYAAQYPIKLILQETNKGAARNWKDLMDAPVGKYVAYFEGDDAWIDPLKLKKQVRILENNEDIAACYSNAKVFDTKNPDSNIWFTEKNKQPVLLDCYSAVTTFTMPTCTIFFRNLLRPLPEWALRARSGDMLLVAMITKFGKICYIDECLGIHNHHYSGIYRSTTEADFLVNDFFAWLDLHQYYNNERKIWPSIVQKCIAILGRLYYTGHTTEARKLFWKWPLLKVLGARNKRLQVFKMAISFHIPYYLFLKRKYSATFKSK